MQTNFIKERLLLSGSWITDSYECSKDPVIYLFPLPLCIMTLIRKGNDPHTWLHNVSHIFSWFCKVWQWQARLHLLAYMCGTSTSPMEMPQTTRVWAWDSLSTTFSYCVRSCSGQYLAQWKRSPGCSSAVGSNRACDPHGPSICLYCNPKCLQVLPFIDTTTLRVPLFITHPDNL